MPAPRKATADVVKDIRQSYKPSYFRRAGSEYSMASLARKHNLSVGCVSKIVYGITWKRV